MLTMRIAIAGTGGLAYAIAYRILQDTGHQLVLLSRSPNRSLRLPCSTVVVDYTKPNSLEFALRGVDTVISTVTGPGQIELLKAAIVVGVRRFAPAEFGGIPSLRKTNEILDRGQSTMQQWLQYFQSRIQSTSFCCGVLYEHFQPGGLMQSGISQAWPLGVDGSYLINIPKMEANVPCNTDEAKGDVMLCLTSLQDVARFVTRALDMDLWPPVLTMCGQRMGVQELISGIQDLTGQKLNGIQWHDVPSLRAQLAYSQMQQDILQQIQLHALLATAEGRYDFANNDLNALFPDIQPLRFSQWFQAAWGIKPGLHPP